MTDYREQTESIGDPREFPRSAILYGFNMLTLTVTKPLTKTTLFPKLVLLTFATLLAQALPAHSMATDNRPNVVVILVDDLGYSDLGCYGSEIDTPNLDQLATNGLRFTQFYNTGRCWPTRASLLTGYYAQQVRRDKLPGIKPSGGGGKRPAWAPLLPALIKKAGYRSYHSGKWHIDGMPIKSGFDGSYFLGDQARFFNPKQIHIDDKRQPPVELGTDFYATNAIADHAIRMLKEHERDHSEKPFFNYIAFTAPHFPLHALPQDIKKYKDKYLEDWETVRDRRWARQQEMKLVTGKLSEVERETGAPYPRPDDIQAYGPGEVAFPLKWDSLSDQQKQFQATKMALHAAMIDRVDQETGRILNQLRAMKAMKNTMIVFLSDNGCSAELMIRDDGHDPQADPGSAATHLCLGPGWSTTCNTPFRKHKTWVHEGGIATPFVVHWPEKIHDPGSLRHTPGHTIDILPTVFELAGIETEPLDNGPKYPGRSLATVIKSDQSLDREFLWWSHENHKAIRIGDWKAVKTSKTDWELFDLKTDRTETNNMANAHPDRLKEMTGIWQSTEDEFIQKLNQ